MTDMHMEGKVTKLTPEGPIVVALKDVKPGEAFRIDGQPRHMVWVAQGLIEYSDGPWLDARLIPGPSTVNSHCPLHGYTPCFCTFSQDAQRTAELIRKAKAGEDTLTDEQRATIEAAINALSPDELAKLRGIVIRELEDG